MPGYEIYRGASWIDGSPIVAILTQGSANRKTGALDQVWILRADVDPVTAVREGSDRGICGDCPHRKGDDGRSCYVNVGQAPLSVYLAWLRGRYPRITADRLALVTFGRAVRLGAYGDPALLPARILRAATVGARLHTGYTHQWRDPRAAHARAYCMASADSRADATDAVASGWRVFHVGEWKGAGAITCPASAEHEARTGKRVRCEDCGLCGGQTYHGLPTSASVARVVTILPHGSGAGVARRRTVTLTIGATG
jgi:hypothetical protein